MRFAAMPQCRREQWVEWARSHEWGTRAYMQAGVMKGLDDNYTDAEGKFHCDPHEETDSDSLRGWAGY